MNSPAMRSESAGCSNTPKNVSKGRAYNFSFSEKESGWIVTPAGIFCRRSVRRGWPITKISFSASMCRSNSFSVTNSLCFRPSESVSNSAAFIISGSRFSDSTVITDGAPFKVLTAGGISEGESRLKISSAGSAVSFSGRWSPCSSNEVARPATNM